MMRKSTFLTVAIVTATILTISGCVWIFRTVDVKSVTPESSDEVTSPIKAHLLDGTIALFPAGATFEDDSLFGEGRLYALRMDTATRVQSLSLEQIAAVETYEQRTLTDKSVAVSLLATLGTVIATPFIMVAIFGSCPTIYSEADSEMLLEAESFSNSIVPLFEKRDVDRLHAQPDASGLMELEVRNEALETHYINHLELVEVTHRPGALAVPAELGTAMVLSDLRPASSATDRAGRNVSDVLHSPDGVAFRTDPAILKGVHVDDLTDYIDLVVPSPSTDTVAVLLRLRNSLLNTVLFYDYMLKAQGPRALEWMSKDLNTVSAALTLGDFYQTHMGLRVAVRDGDVYREVGRVREVGPIAWSDVAVSVPVPKGDSLHIRLSFIADAWRIDHVAVALEVDRETVRRLPLDRVLDADRETDQAAHVKLTHPDHDYLITMPGQRFWIQFETDPAPENREHTYFIAAQGYYTEWMRGTWLREEEPRDFEPTAETLLAVIHRWSEVMPSFEARFESTKIPVR